MESGLEVEVVEHPIEQFVLLSCGDDQYLRPISVTQAADDWSDLDDLGAGSNDKDECSHLSGSSELNSTSMMHVYASKQKELSIVDQSLSKNSFRPIVSGDAKAVSQRQFQIRRGRNVLGFTKPVPQRTTRTDTIRFFSREGIVIARSDDYMWKENQVLVNSVKPEALAKASFRERDELRMLKVAIDLAMTC